MTKPKKPTTRKVKAWAVVCPANGNVWAFEHKDAAKQAKVLHDEEKHGKHKVLPCTITYQIPKRPKK